MASYDEVAQLLARTPAADELFEHLTSRLAGDHYGEFFVVGTMSGAILIVNGSGEQIASDGPLDELEHWGLIRVIKFNNQGKPVYRVTNDAWDFQRQRQQLPAPIERVVAEAAAVTGSAEFEQWSPSAANQLRRAFEMLDGGITATEDVSTFGHHLRSALIDAVCAATGSATPSEDVIGMLSPWKRSAGAAGRAETAVEHLVELAISALRLTQGGDHVRDELSKGRPAADPETLERAARLTAMTCFELFRWNPAAGEATNT